MYVSNWGGTAWSRGAIGTTLIDNVCIEPENPYFDLALTKTVNTTVANSGSNVTFTITLTNQGLTTLTSSQVGSIRVRDLLPSGFTFVSATPSSQYNATTGLWTLPSTSSLAPNASRTLTIIATVTTGGTNCTEITAFNQPDVDSTPNNNSTTEDDDACVTVTPPAPCSLNTPQTTLTCDGKGTPNTADDTFSYNITVSGTSTGSSYGISGDDTRSGLTYNTSQGPFGNFLISSGNKNLTITDATTSTCTTTATLTPPAPCSPPPPSCSLNSPSTSSTCNDNGTPSDPNDDVFSYNITVTGTNTGTTYGITGGDTRSGLAYNTQQGAFGTFPISGGNLSLTVSDATNAGCTTSTTVQAPAACSTPPAGGTINVTKTLAGGPGKFEADYIFTLSCTNPVNTYNQTVLAGETARFENIPVGSICTLTEQLPTPPAGYIFTGSSPLLTPAGPYTITTAGQVINVDAVNTLIDATTCTLNSPTTSSTCNDNGTPSNPNDDVFSYNITVTGTNTGTTYDISGGDTRSGLAYNTQQGAFGTFPISGGNLSLTISDATNAGCTTSTTVQAPAACSTPPPICSLDITSVSATQCSGGTYSATVNMSYNNPVSGTVTVSDGTVTQTFTPDGTSPDTIVLNNIACDGQSHTVEAFFTNDPICQAAGETYAAPPPAGTCTITAPNVTGVCNDNGTPSNPADDTFTYVANVTGTDVGASNQYNISGGDTRTGLTYGLNQGPFGSFPISGGNLSLTATDVDIPTCMDAFTVTAPATCSSVIQQADLSLVKTASSTTVTAGQQFSYTLTLTNNGPVTTTNVQVRDILSPMLTYLSCSMNGGATSACTNAVYNPTTGIWTAGTLSSGQVVTLTITVQAP